MSSGLFGINHTNRPDAQHWTKNCFNSSFPTSLACYMMAHKINAVYAHLAIVDGELKVVCDEIPIADLFNSRNTPMDKLQFDFESVYEPFQDMSFDKIDGIDLVVRNTDGHYLAPVEIKLTVLPTSATASKPMHQWGSEIVVRSATTSYIAFSVWNAVKHDAIKVRAIFEKACSNIESWTNDFEMSHKIVNIKYAIDRFERQYIECQRPLVLQALWKTQGQSPVLCDDAFDIVVWSDLAFSRLFIETKNEESMSRPMRASAKMARCIWELSKSGKIHVDEIYRQMAFGQQTDKEMSIPGDRWRKYITTDRTMHLAVPKSALTEIIDPNFIENLKPERRFDQTLYFTMRN